MRQRKEELVTSAMAAQGDNSGIKKMIKSLTKVGRHPDGTKTAKDFIAFAGGSQLGPQED